MTENEAIRELDEMKNDLYALGYFEDTKKEIEIFDMATAALKEIQQYREIGTAEECRKAVEKQKPKKPHRNYKKFSGLWCKCGWYLGQKQCLDIKYCPNCGQAIDENLEGMEDENT